MPFTSAFCISGQFTWPVILGSLITLFLFVWVITGQKIVLSHSKPLKLVLLFLFNVCLSFFINDILIPPNAIVLGKTVNHLIAYLASFINFYLSISLLLIINNAENIFPTILKIITWTLFISCVFAIVEFVSKNFFAFDFDHFIPHPNVETIDALALGDLFRSVRARGFAEEPGHFAFMLNLFIPLSVYYLFFINENNVSKLSKILFIISFIIALIITFSTAAFASLPVAIFITSIYYWRIWVQHISKISLGLVILVLAVWLFNKYFPIITQLALDIEGKVSNSGSVDDRSIRTNNFFAVFGKAPIWQKLIGYGPSGYLRAGLNADSDSFLVLYQTIIFESGIIGLSLFGMFLWNVFQLLKNVAAPLNFFIFLSLVYGTIHYFFISNYWYPWYWFICALVFIIQPPSLSKQKTVEKTCYTYYS